MIASPFMRKALIHSQGFHPKPKHLSLDFNFQKCRAEELRFQHMHPLTSHSKHSNCLVNHNSNKMRSQNICFKRSKLFPYKLKFKKVVLNITIIIILIELES